MITRAASVLLAAVALLSTSGCAADCPRGGTDSSFAWPADVACPKPEEAELYMGAYAGPGECGISIVSVDGPGVHTKDGCTYSLTVGICSDCGGHF